MASTHPAVAVVQSPDRLLMTTLLMADQRTFRHCRLMRGLTAMTMIARASHAIRFSSCAVICKTLWRQTQVT